MWCLQRQSCCCLKNGKVALKHNTSNLVKYFFKVEGRNFSEIHFTKSKKVIKNILIHFFANRIAFKKFEDTEAQLLKMLVIKMSSYVVNTYIIHFETGKILSIHL